ncbi:ABC-type sugar transport system ATPase subunit [Sinorhizobium meliloti]
MASIDIANIKKSYGTHPVLHDVDLKISDGEFVVLVGPSGCGKSTLLRMIAGLESVTGGEIRIAGRRVNELAPKDRDIAMVFQSYALYPHMSVARNMSYSLRLRKTAKDRITTVVAGAAAKLGLDPLLDRRPKALSGGQRQRASPWAAPSCASRRRFSSTNRSPTSMRACASRCAPRSRNCTRISAPPPSM